jgi:hypothetical protein
MEDSGNAGGGPFFTILYPQSSILVFPSGGTAAGGGRGGESTVGELTLRGGLSLAHAVRYAPLNKAEHP